jgi:hypothetical protein
MKEFNRWFLIIFVLVAIIQLLFVAIAWPVLTSSDISLQMAKMFTGALLLIFMLTLGMSIHKVPAYLRYFSIQKEAYGVTKGTGGVLVAYRGENYIFRNFAAGLFDPENKVNLKAVECFYFLNFRKPVILVSLNDGEYIAPE